MVQRSQRAPLHGDREEERDVLKCLDAVAGRRDEQNVASRTLPRILAGDQLQLSAEDIQRRLTRAVMLGQSIASSEGNDSLAQAPLVAAVHRLRTTATGRAGGEFELLSGLGSQRHLLHDRSMAETGEVSELNPRIFSDQGLRS